MRFKVVLSVLVSLALIATAVVIFPACSSGQAMPFGEQEDVDFGTALWTAMADYQGWKMQSDFYPGGTPHGMFVRLYYNMVTVDGTPYHVIAKDNYGGEGVTLETLAADPTTPAMAVTVMVQREAGYDADNNDWFWVKYMGDGMIEKNADGMALAGRVAKGMEMGCIACHAKAKGGDYLFSNDH